MDSTEIEQNMSQVKLRQASRASDLPGVVDYFNILVGDHNITKLQTKRGNMHISVDPDSEGDAPPRVSVRYDAEESRIDPAESDSGEPRYLTAIQYHFVPLEDGGCGVTKEKILSRGVSGGTLESREIALNDPTREALQVLGYVHSKVERAWGNALSSDDPRVIQGSEAFKEIPAASSSAS